MELTRQHILDRIDAYPLGDDPARMRRQFARLACEARPGVACDLRITDEATGITVCPGGAPTRSRLLWFHGGGYVFGSPETHLRAAGYLSRAADMDVVLPRYRLAPEHPWPAQLADAIAAATGDGRPTILMGDSAGGHLALVTTLELARRGRMPRGMILLSPNTDRTGLSNTRAANDDADPMVDDAGDRRLASLCFDGLADDDIQVSPVLDDLSILPPTHVEVGADEVLLDDSRILFERARGQGAQVDLHVDPDLIHMGQIWAPCWSPARVSLDRVAAFARSLAED